MSYLVSSRPGQSDVLHSPMCNSPYRAKGKGEEEGNGKKNGIKKKSRFLKIRRRKMLIETGFGNVSFVAVSPSSQPTDRWLGILQRQSDPESEPAR